MTDRPLAPYPATAAEERPDAMPELRQAVRAADIVRALSACGLSQRDIARAAGASERSVRNWLRHAAMRSDHREALDMLQQVALLLAGVLRPRGIGAWLRAPNPMLQGRRPVDLLAAGHEAAAVMDAAAAFRDGDYA